MEFDLTTKSISRAKEMFEKQRAKVEDELYTQKILYGAWFSEAMHATSRYDLIPAALNAAFNEQHNTKKADRQRYESVKEMICEDFFGGAKCKFSQIISLGYESYGYEFEIEFNGRMYYLDIPVKEQIDINNFQYSRFGMIAVCVGNSIRKTLCESYRVDDIAEAIRKYDEEVHRVIPL